MHSASCYLCKQVEREPASSPSQFTNSPSLKAHKEGVLPLPGRSGELILRKATVSKCGFRISRRSGVVAHGVVTGSSTVAAEAGGSWEFEARLICTVSFIPAWAREWNPYALPPRKKNASVLEKYWKISLCLVPTGLKYTLLFYCLFWYQKFTSSTGGLLADMDLQCFCNKY